MKEDYYSMTRADCDSVQFIRERFELSTPDAVAVVDFIEKRREEKRRKEFGSRIAALAQEGFDLCFRPEDIISLVMDSWNEYVG